MDLIVFNSQCNFVPPDYIIDHVYLGSEDSASYENELEKLNVKSILVVGKGLTIHFPEKIDYKQIHIMDMSEEDIISHFDSAVDFLVSARSKGNVLVHCAMGVSRSASMVIAYLVREHNKSLADALSYLKEKRPCIKPNRGFLRQLRLYTTNLDLDGTIPREFLL